MKKESMIRVLRYKAENIKTHITPNFFHEVANALETEQEPCEDAISRQAVIDAIFAEPLYKPGMKKRYAEEAVPAIFEKIKLLPYVTPQQRTGHWIKPKGKVKPFGDDTVQCDMCGFFTDVDCYYNFCPNCGCMMVED